MENSETEINVELESFNALGFALIFSKIGLRKLNGIIFVII
jgi:hypothetical protein